jgi:hypothetical protein
MAAVNITVTGLNQKIARNTQVAATEDVWTITSQNFGTNVPLLCVRPSVDTYYHTTSGQTATDGWIIKAGQVLPVRIASTTTVFYLRPVSTAGTIDCVVVAADDIPASAAALTTDAAASLTQGNSQKATYTISTLTAAPASANYAVLNIEAGATKTPRIRRVIISNPGFGTAAALLTFELVRTTSASSGGTATVPAPHDTTDAAYSGLARKDGATLGTIGTQITTFSIFQPATAAANFAPAVFEFYGQMSKAMTIPAGTANGIALRCINGNAGATGFCASMEVTDE